MGLLQAARDAATALLGGDQSQEQTPDQAASRDATQDALGNHEVATRTSTGGGQARSGTVVTKAGDSVSGLAKLGTGDALRYRELNAFNGRDAEDASLEPGDILYVPEGWDIVAMGGAPEPAQQPAPPPAPEPEPEPGTGHLPGVWEIVELGRQKLEDTGQSAYDVAYGAYEAGSSALWGTETEPQEVEQAIEDSVEEAAEEVLDPGVGAEQGLTQDQREQFVRYREEDGEQVVDQTVEGETPLEIARKQAEKGDAGTKYAINTAALAKVQSGDPSADTFWCSGFMIWTLAAYGMDVNAAIKGANGQDYSYKNPGGKTYPITLKRMMDGEPEAVGAMHYAAEQGIQGGYIGQCGTDFDEGYGSDKFEGSADEHSLAVKGAAGAFEMAGIGTEVSETDSRPGDFNQARWKAKYRYYDASTDSWKDDDSKPVDFYGQGHAWMTGAVIVTGSAWVGLPGSPLVDGKAASEVAWAEGVSLTLDETTDPALVGELGPVQSADRVEANISSGIERGNREDANGGLQVTGMQPVPAASSKSGYVNYVGRLGGTPWASHTPASADRAPDGVEIPGLEPEAPAEAVPDADGGESWTEWGKRMIGV